MASGSQTSVKSHTHITPSHKTPPPHHSSHTDPPHLLHGSTTYHHRQTTKHHTRQLLATDNPIHLQQTHQHLEPTCTHSNHNHHTPTTSHPHPHTTTTTTTNNPQLPQLWHQPVTNPTTAASPKEPAPPTPSYATPPTLMLTQTQQTWSSLLYTHYKCFILMTLPKLITNKHC